MAKLNEALLFRSYIWLIDTIYSAGHITREEINRKWARESSLNYKNESAIPERTFHNWKHACEEMFDVNIECDRARGRAYYIENAEDMQKGGIRNWLINTFAVNNLITESKHLKGQILFEPIPSGQRFLTPIIEAMRDKTALVLTYQSFQYANTVTYIVYPYCVKVFKQRWYMLAKKEGKTDLRLFALDRFVSLEPTDKSYKIPKDFDAEKYFASTYGVSGVEVPPEHIEIKVRAMQANYLRSLPLHSSQKEIEKNEDYSIFRYFVVPSYEFKQELRSHGADLEVLSPQWFRDEMSDEIAELHEIYTDSPIHQLTDSPK